MSPNRWLLSALMIPFCLALFSRPAFSETVELVTYYPTSANTGDLHVRSLTVGDEHRDEALDDGEVLIFDRMGIGTTTPRDRLHVAGGGIWVAANTNNVPLRLVSEGSAVDRKNWTMETDRQAGDILSFKAVNDAVNTTLAEPLVLTRDGKVGIGTNTPGQSLTVNGVVRIDGAAASLTMLELAKERNAKWQIGQMFFPDIGLSFKRITQQPNIGYIDLHLSNDGHIGVGTETPRARLHIKSDPRPGVPMDILIEKPTPDPPSRTPRLGLVDTWQSGVDTAPVWFIDNFRDKFRVVRQPNISTVGIATIAVTSNGYVGMGTEAPVAPLHLLYNGAPGVRVERTADWPAIDWVAPGKSWRVQVGDDDIFRITRNVAPSRHMVGVDSNGNLTLFQGKGWQPGGGAWGNSTSDLRLKKEIQPIEGALSKLLKLQGVTFDWKEPEKFPPTLQGRQMGMIAQEVERVFPQWVQTGPEGTKGISLNGFEALTIEAIRNLHQENETLKKRVEELERRQPISSGR